MIGDKSSYKETPCIDSPTDRCPGIYSYLSGAVRLLVRKPDKFLPVLSRGLFFCAVQGEFAVNAPASKTVVIKPSGKEPFPASWARERVVSNP